MKEAKSTKKIIIGVIITILIIAIAIGLIIYQNKQANKSVGTVWGDIYYAYLKETSEKQLDMQDAKLQFCEVEPKQNPYMIMTYNKDNKSYINSYKIEEDNKVTYIDYKQPADLVLLYNIKLQKYVWYIHTESDEQDVYTPLQSINNQIEEENTEANSTINNENVATEEMETEYTFKKDEATTVQKGDGQTISISKFEEVFIKPEAETSKEIEFNINFNEKEIKTAVIQMVEGFKTEEQIVTEQVKTAVEEKIAELQNKQQQIQIVQEEKTKQEEEARKITEQNVQTKLEENLKWFAAAYLGTDYGWPTVFEYKDVTGIVAPPQASQAEMVYEVVGLTSVQNLKTQLATYVDESKFSKFSQGVYGSNITQNMVDYNEKVYVHRGGIGAGPAINTKNAKVLSSENGVSKVQLIVMNELTETQEGTVTLTIENNKETGKYLITDWVSSK